MVQSNGYGQCTLKNSFFYHLHGFYIQNWLNQIYKKTYFDAKFNFWSNGTIRKSLGSTILEKITKKLRPGQFYLKTLHEILQMRVWEGIDAFQYLFYTYFTKFLSKWVPESKGQSRKFFFQFLRTALFSIWSWAFMCIFIKICKKMTKLGVFLS